MAQQRVVAAVGIYGALAAIAWAGSALTGHTPWYLPQLAGGSHWISIPIALVAGGLVGRSTAAASRWLVRNARWGRTLESELRMGLYGLNASATAPLAIASAVGEEMFFRGAVQTGLVAVSGTWTGLFIASGLFGLVHVPWNRRLRSWTLMATVMGVVFGALYLATGELLAPIVAHAVINHENLGFMLRDEAREVRSNERPMRSRA